MDDQEIESLHSIQVEENYANDVQDVEITNGEEVCKHAPSLGMVFKTYEEAYDYYNSYGRIVGFSVRKQRLDKNKRSGLIIRREFCCNREGYYAKKDTPTKKRDSIRCGCKAMLEVKFMGPERIVVSNFLDEHNHDFVPYSSSHLLRSQRAIDPSQKDLITTMHASGLKQSQIFSYFSTQAGGPQNLNFIQTDCNSQVQKNRVEFLKKGDASCLNDYFKQKKKENKFFFHSVRTNLENELTGFFFCDAKSRRDYALFGDVLCFDTTFNTNKYNLLCAPIIGINNHGQTLLFGCGVIDGESEIGCEWLFNTFLEAMGGKKPITIFTDQAAGIGNAIAKVFPESDHRLCLWHIYQNAGKHLSHIYGDSKQFSRDFKSCIYDPETIEEFEKSWDSLLDSYDGLRENSWIQGIYSLREKWAQVFARGHFCAGVTTTQRKILSLKRWCVDVSDEDVELYGEIIICDPDPIYLVRYSELSHLSQKIVARSSKNPQLYEFVKSGFMEMEAKLESLAIVDDQEHLETCINIDTENDPKDPKTIKSRFGGKGKKKQTLEIRAPKKKAPSKRKDCNEATTQTTKIDHHVTGGLSSSYYAPNQMPVGFQYGLPIRHNVNHAQFGLSTSQVNYNFGNQDDHQMSSMIFPSHGYPQTLFESTSQAVVPNHFMYPSNTLYSQGVFQPSFQDPVRQLDFSDHSTSRAQDTTGFTYDFGL